MKRLAFVKANHLDKLCDELAAAGLTFSPTVTGKGENVFIYVPETVTDEEIQKINEIVSNHDPTPPTLPASPDELLAQAISSATTIEELKAALLGDVKEAMAKGAPKNGG